MIVLIAIHADGTEKQFGIGDSVQSLIREIKRYDIERLVVGEVNKQGSVEWEKQFSETTVVPSGFGSGG